MYDMTRLNCEVTLHQCAFPVFKGLLPEPHNTIILDLLFQLATWHAFTKLHLHTDDTLSLFKRAMMSLSRVVNKFHKTTCAYYHTTELSQEYAARGWRKAALAAKNPQASTSTARLATGPKVKTLNLSTYKYHTLGNYVGTIQQFGTTDNYSTQTVSFFLSFTVLELTGMRICQGELEHHSSKRCFVRSGKKKTTMVTSIADQEAIEWFVRQVNATWESINAKEIRQQRPAWARLSPSDHYHIAATSWHVEDLLEWVGEQGEDPVVTVGCALWNSSRLMVHISEFYSSTQRPCPGARSGTCLWQGRIRFHGWRPGLHCLWEQQDL